MAQLEHSIAEHHRADQVQFFQQSHRLAVVAVEHVRRTQQAETVAQTVVQVVAVQLQAVRRHRVELATHLALLHHKETTAVAHQIRAQQVMTAVRAVVQAERVQLEPPRALANRAVLELHHPLRAVQLHGLRVEVHAVIQVAQRVLLAVLTRATVAVVVQVKQAETTARLAAQALSFLPTLQQIQRLQQLVLA